MHTFADPKFICNQKDQEKQTKIKRIDIIELLLNNELKWEFLKEQNESKVVYDIFPPTSQAILKVENHLK